MSLVAVQVGYLLGGIGVEAICVLGRHGQVCGRAKSRRAGGQTTALQRLLLMLLLLLLGGGGGAGQFWRRVLLKVIAKARQVILHRQKAHSAIKAATHSHILTQLHYLPWKECLYWKIWSGSIWSGF